MNIFIQERLKKLKVSWDGFQKRTEEITNKKIIVWMLSQHYYIHFSLWSLGYWGGELCWLLLSVEQQKHQCGAQICCISCIKVTTFLTFSFLDFFSLDSGCFSRICSMASCRDRKNMDGWISSSKKQHLWSFSRMYAAGQEKQIFVILITVPCFSAEDLMTNQTIIHEKLDFLIGNIYRDYWQKKKK